LIVMAKKAREAPQILSDDGPSAALSLHAPRRLSSPRGAANALMGRSARVPAVAANKSVSQQGQDDALVLTDSLPDDSNCWCWSSSYMFDPDDAREQRSESSSETDSELGYGHNGDGDETKEDVVEVSPRAGGETCSSALGGTGRHRRQRHHPHQHHAPTFPEPWSPDSWRRKPILQQVRAHRKADILGFLPRCVAYLPLCEL
jgi:hypothetical protein